MQTVSRGITLDQLSQTQSTVNEAVSTRSPYILLQKMLATFSPAHSHTHLCRSLAQLASELLESDLCLVMLAEGEQLVFETSYPDLSAYRLDIKPISIDPALRKRLGTAGLSRELPELSVHQREQLNPLQDISYGSLLIMPLLVEATCIGTLHCYFRRARDLTPEEQTILFTLTGHASLAIQNRQLVESSLSAKTIKAFFDELFAEQHYSEQELDEQATALGCNLTHAHVILMLEVAQVQDTGESDRTLAYRVAIRQVQQRLREVYPGVLLYEQEYLITCMVPLEKDVTAGRLKSWLDETVLYLEQAQDITLSAGVGRVCQNIADYRISFAEAKEAVKIGRCLHKGSSCTFFSELGAARYVYDFVLANNLSDVYLEQIAILDSYDQHHKRAELLDTLETYLAHGCCLKETAEILKVHRNTLVQRIERIQSLCDAVNISQSTNHFPLQAAILVYRMRSRGK